MPPFCKQFILGSLFPNFTFMLSSVHFKFLKKKHAFISKSEVETLWLKKTLENLQGQFIDDKEDFEISKLLRNYVNCKL